MDIKELETPIQEIITLVEKIDEKYREKCFEILLNFYLEEKFPLPTAVSVESKGVVGSETEPKEFIVPIDVKAFFKENNVQEELLKKLFLMQENEIRPIYKITTTKKATAQIQIALLTALQNALGKTGKFAFSEEIVRQRCKDLKAHDPANFAAIWKDSARLFKSLSDPQNVELSADGRTELADVISTVAK